MKPPILVAILAKSGTPRGSPMPGSCNEDGAARLSAAGES